MVQTGYLGYLFPWFWCGTGEVGAQMEDVVVLELVGTQAVQVQHTRVHVPMDRLLVFPVLVLDGTEAGQEDYFYWWSHYLRSSLVC
jgi:hypothetical protein